MVLAIALAAIMCVPAFAYDETQSGVSTISLGGYTYTYYSIIGRYPPRLTAQIRTHSNEDVPVGYMGVQPRIYSQAGTLVALGNWSYNSSVCSGMLSSISKEVQPDVYFYSRGMVQFYNGNGYTTYTSNASPYMSVATKSISAVPTNANGEVYGSELFLEAIGVKADLISAIGENGVAGYVKATDLENLSAKTLAEALQPVRANRAIPLYESDGETVIGSFIIQDSISTVIK